MAQVIAAHDRIAGQVAAVRLQGCHLAVDEKSADVVVGRVSLQPHPRADGDAGIAQQRARLVKKGDLEHAGQPHVQIDHRTHQRFLGLRAEGCPAAIPEADLGRYDDRGGRDGTLHGVPPSTSSAWPGKYTDNPGRSRSGSSISLATARERQLAGLPYVSSAMPARVSPVTSR